MLHLFVALQSFFTDLPERFEREDGATAVEYGLMVALIAVGIIVAVIALEDALSALFNRVATCLGGGAC